MNGVRRNGVRAVETVEPTETGEELFQRTRAPLLLRVKGPLTKRVNPLVFNVSKTDPSPARKSPTNDMIFLYIVGGLRLVAKTLPYVVAICEKEHIRGDLVPQEFDPARWKSDYLPKKIAEAKAAGLVPCGSYFTSPHASVVKGPLLLYRTADRRAVVGLISARIAGVENKKIEVSTRFVDGTALRTSDGPFLPDFTGVVAKETCYNAPLAEVLARHAARLDLAGKAPVLVPDGGAFDVLEQIETTRGESMVAGGFARWVDPAQTKLRRTWKGVVRSVSANREQARMLIREQVAKAKNAKVQPVPPRSSSPTSSL